jgi:hypothetical protein
MQPLGPKNIARQYKREKSNSKKDSDAHNGGVFFCYLTRKHVMIEEFGRIRGRRPPIYVRANLPAYAPPSCVDNCKGTICKEPSNSTHYQPNPHIRMSRRFMPGKFTASLRLQSWQWTLPTYWLPQYLQG